MRWSFLPDAWSCAAKVLLSTVVACWWWWLAPCLPSPPSSAPGLVLLLLDLLLITCPSPPGLGLELQSIIKILLDVFLCLCGAVQELVLFLVLLLYWSNESCFSWWSSSSRLLVLLAAVVLPALAFSSVTKLLVSCVLVSFTQLDLIHPWPCCETAMHSSALYPQWFKRTDASLGH
jgi:hypothetical protein